MNDGCEGDNVVLPDWFIGFIVAIILSLIGCFLAWLQRRVEKREEQLEAAAALRFELELNLRWADDIINSHNYLRDESWVNMKNKGYISILHRPIPINVINVYHHIYKLNDQIRLLKEEKITDIKIAETYRNELLVSIKELNSMIDKFYPKIARNFHE